MIRSRCFYTARNDSLDVGDFVQFILKFARRSETSREVSQITFNQSRIFAWVTKSLEKSLFSTRYFCSKWLWIIFAAWRRTFLMTFTNDILNDASVLTCRLSLHAIKNPLTCTFGKRYPRNSQRLRSSSTVQSASKNLINLNALCPTSRVAVKTAIFIIFSPTL